MGTWIVGIVVIGIIAFAARMLYNDKKGGNACGSCKGCKGCDSSRS